MRGLKILRFILLQSARHDAGEDKRNCDVSASRAAVH